MLTLEIKTALLEALAEGLCFLDAVWDVSTKFNLDVAANQALIEYGLSI